MTTPNIYQPLFTITPEILNLAAGVGEGAGRLLACLNSQAMRGLRRQNLERAIYGTLALEGGPLAENEISLVLDGAEGKFAPREIQKTRNTLTAYEYLPRLTPHVEADLLTAHRALLTGLSNRPGQYRQEGDAATAGGRTLHLAPPAARVPILMRNLCKRLQHPRFHPIITACIAHYELELIHPFIDGNGRLGRLWQTLILSAWNPALAYVPVDYQLVDYQEDYFQALQYASELADAAPFVDFMLHMLDQAVRDLAERAAPAGQTRPEEAAEKIAPAPAKQPKAPLPAKAEKTAAAQKISEAGPTPRPRGRPRKVRPEDAPAPAANAEAPAITPDEAAAPPTIIRRRGRPPKNANAAVAGTEQAPSPVAVKTTAQTTPQAPAAATPSREPAPAAPEAESSPQRPLSFLDKVRAHAQKPSQLRAIAEDEARLRAEAEAEARALAEAQKQAATAAPPDDGEPETTDHQFQTMADALGREARDREYTSRELMAIMRLSDRKWFRTHYLNPCLEDGFMETTLPRGTTSRNQRYRVAEKGRKYLPRPKKRVRAE